VTATTGLASVCACALSYLGYFFYSKDGDFQGVDNWSRDSGSWLGLDSFDSFCDTIQAEVITLDNYLKLNESNWFVNICTPWSKPCQDFEPLWHELLQRMCRNHREVNVQFAYLDAQEYPGIAAWLEVVHYPTLRWIRDGNMRSCSINNLEALETYLLGGWQKQHVRMPLGIGWSFLYELQIRLWNDMCIRQMRFHTLITESIPNSPWTFLAAFILLAILVWATILYIKWFYKTMRHRMH
jgi:hypothetical protein